MAVIFGISIILIYSSLGIIVSLTSAGAGFANALGTHWIPNIIFFALFVVFAISFFGAFEIVLPNKWVTGADSKVDKGGILAAFFHGTDNGDRFIFLHRPDSRRPACRSRQRGCPKTNCRDVWLRSCICTPIHPLALFPSVLNRMPRSGGWLNSVKVVLGFIMLAFSMKFLSTIDSVYSLGFISRDLFLSVWIVFFTLLGFYLFGKIKFAHDSDLPHIGTSSIFLVITVFTFVIYLITGLFGAPLKGLSSLLPSQESSWFHEKTVNRKSVQQLRHSRIQPYTAVLGTKVR